MGHQIPFGYCRRENQGAPCQRTLKCWEPWPELIASLRETMTPQDWDRAFNTPPKPKVITLVELIEKAKKTKRAI